MDQSVSEHNWEALKEHYHHYKNIDFHYWERRANYIVGRILKLKREKSKYHYYLDLYATYVQMVESTFINMMAIMSGQLFEYLFIDSKALKEAISNMFPKMGPENPVSDRWVREFVFQHAVFRKYTVDNPEQKIKEYKTMLKEACEDYLHDFQLLNAFKHGFRIEASGETTVAISVDGDSPRIPHVVGQYNASILYYSKGQVEDETGRHDAVFKNRISFNYQRVYQKILYLSNALENTRMTILHIAKPENVGKEVICRTLKVTDSQEFQRHFGSYRWREVLRVYPPEADSS